MDRDGAPSLVEILALSDDALALFDTDATIAAVSPAFRRLFQPIETFLVRGTPWTLFLTEATRHSILPVEVGHRLSMIEESLADPRAPTRQLTARTTSGVLRFALTATSDGGFALKVDPGNGDQIATERELEQLMAKVLEACPTCLTMARIGDGHILYRSPEATALLGKGFDSREQFVHREERADFVTALLPNARVDEMRFTARRADGTKFPASISARLIDYRGEDVIVSSILDLTDELAMQDELAHQRDQVFQSEKLSALGEVLAGVAHELNNPLSIVVGNAHMLLEDGIDGARLKRVEKLSEAAERCVAIVRAFLSMARDRPLSIQPVPVGQLLETARDAYKSGEVGNVTVTISAGEGLPDLLIDEVQMVQVLSNLMTNAEHAFGDGGGLIQLRATAAPARGRVRIRLTDDGPGIPASIAGRIFDPLFTTKKAGKGTGIGLALCHRIVTAHGGTIDLDRRHRAGASFVIDLPVARDDTIETQRRLSRPAIESANSRR